MLRAIFLPSLIYLIQLSPFQSFLAYGHISEDTTFGLCDRITDFIVAIFIYVLDIPGSRSKFHK